MKNEDKRDDELDTKSELDELLERAKATYELAEAGWKDNREAALEDLRFYHGKQWDESLNHSGEPMVSVNRLPTMTKQIENEIRQQEMDIIASASDEEGSEDTANILSSMIRGIWARSNGKSAAIHAAGEAGALVPGYGFIKVELDYVDHKSWDQEIWIRPVRDPMSILPDPNAEMPDFSDGEYWFEIHDYPEHVFKRVFPFAECTSAEWFSDESKGTWMPEGNIRVCRYWYKKEVSSYTFLLDDGSVVQEDDVSDWEYDPDNDEEKRFAWVDDKKSKERNRKAIMRHRRVTSSTIHWCDFTGAEILDEGDHTGKYFPFSAVTGPSTQVDGKRLIRGIIHFAKDSQKQLNYIASSMIRRMATANKAPWIVSREAIAGFETMWENAHIDNRAFLLWNQKNPEGNGEPNVAPTRADQTGQIADLMQAAQKVEMDLKACMGIYDAGLGATPNEQSGVAIKTLAQQGKNANFHFSDNLTSALKHLGEIIIDLIPKVYSEARMVKTVNEEGEEKLVKINQLTKSKGEQTVFDIAGAAGHYGITVDVGPAYATAKQAAIEQLTELARVNPQMMPYVQDRIVRNMDFDGKDEVADRLLAVLAQVAPHVIKDGDQPDIPPQVAATLQQLQQQGQALLAENAQLKQLIQSKQLEHQQAMEKAQFEAQSTAQLQDQKYQGEMAILSNRAQSEERVASAQLELQNIKTQLEHNTQMMKVVLEATKLFGTSASEVIAQETPGIDQALDQATQT